MCVTQKLGHTCLPEAKSKKKNKRKGEREKEKATKGKKGGHACCATVSTGPTLLHSLLRLLRHRHEAEAGAPQLTSGQECKHRPDYKVHDFCYYT